MVVDRQIEKSLEKDLTKGKVIVVMGARQVGKTTLLRKLRAKKDRVLWLNCDDASDASYFAGKTINEIGQVLKGYEMLLIDEAQRMSEPGLTLKKIADLHLDLQVVVTGSSSFQLSNGIYESALGRIIEYKLFPMSMQEMAAATSMRDESSMLKNRMIFGEYPEVVNDLSDARRILTNIVSDNLYKDIFAYKGLRKADVLVKLVQALALQVGSEVSYTELGNLLRVNSETVETYVDLLEKCYIVFRLPSFGRNMRNEIKKGKKVYFVDNGVRNAVIHNFAPLDLRNDVGALWENLMISERMKRNAYNWSYAGTYFWRTREKSEIDYVEDEDGKISTFEFKWNGKARAKMPIPFAKAYPNSSFSVVSQDNYWDFI